MTTVQLTDTQLAQFTACGLIVVDGEECSNDCKRFDGRVPGHIYGSNWPWVPCQTCMGTSAVAPEWLRKLTEPCATCGPPNVGQGCPDCDRGRRVVTLTAMCPECRGEGQRRGFLGVYSAIDECQHCDGEGVVTLGRFTIRVDRVADAHQMAPDVDPGGIVVELDDSSLVMLPRGQPLPQPGQFAVAFEPVAALTGNSPPARPGNPGAEAL